MPVASRVAWKQDLRKAIEFLSSLLCLSFLPHPFPSLFPPGSPCVFLSQPHFYFPVSLIFLSPSPLSPSFSLPSSLYISSLSPIFLSHLSPFSLFIFLSPHFYSLLPHLSVSNFLSCFYLSPPSLFFHLSSLTIPPQALSHLSLSLIQLISPLLHPSLSPPYPVCLSVWAPHYRLHSGFLLIVEDVAHAAPILYSPSLVTPEKKECFLP